MHIDKQNVILYIDFMWQNKMENVCVIKILDIKLNNWIIVSMNHKYAENITLQFICAPLF